MLRLVLLATAVQAQLKVLQAQTNTWNSTFKLSEAQISAANISSTTAHNVEIALNFERTNNAGDLTQDDPFYDLPPDYDIANPPPPGTVLKVEEHTNVSFYTLPPSLAMSRFLYMSETLNGTATPASAYVLWPYLPRSFQHLKSCSGRHAKRGPVYPVIAFAHGSSGQTQACAPSGLRTLWDEFHEPFPMALAGYAVVAPDYAGLGVANITSPYFVLPTQANDLFQAVAAAKSVWPDLLSDTFVVAGQSQGGGVAWAGAQRQLARPVDGYLGTVALSPFTDILADIAAEDRTQVNVRVVAIAQGLNSVLDSFQLSDWITDAGIARLRLLQEIQGCGTTSSQLFSAEGGTVQILKDGWNTTFAAQWYQNVSSNGRQRFAGPMLVLQGIIDGNAIETVTTPAVQATCDLYPHSQLEYYRFEGIGHVPVLYSGQHLYLDWIADRFNEVPVARKCKQKTLTAIRGIENILKDQNWFLQYNAYGI